MNQHERVSDLHHENLKKEDLVAKAKVKMAKAGISIEPSREEYRDRARERRIAFGVSMKSSLPRKQPTAQPEEAVQNDTAPPPSKGASLLGKMGWSAGEGLGAQGTGMTAPIETDLYAQGVGLGAQGGKLGDAADEAGKNTKESYSYFLEKTKDKAKERFNSMN